MFNLMTFLRRAFATDAKSTEAIQATIAERDARGKRNGIAYGILAKRSNERARAYGIDPPRPGRKTYSERYAETSAMSKSERRSLIAQREAAGKECGVLYRVMAEDD